MRWACNTCQNYVVSPSVRIHTEALRGHMRSDLSLIGSFKCFWLEKFLCFLFHLWKHVEKTFVGETEWILFTIQEFNLTCKQTADVSFCLECTEELKTILEHFLFHWHPGGCVALQPAVVQMNFTQTITAKTCLQKILTGFHRWRKKTRTFYITKGFIN